MKITRARGARPEQNFSKKKKKKGNAQAETLREPADYAADMTHRECHEMAVAHAAACRYGSGKLSHPRSRSHVIFYAAIQSRTLLTLSWPARRTLNLFLHAFSCGVIEARGLVASGTTLLLPLVLSLFL